MKNRSIGACVVALALVVAFCLGQQRVSPGNEPYTPTKLEWLVMELNVVFRTTGEAFNIMYVAHRDNDSVVIVGTYASTFDRATFNQLMEDHKERARGMVAAHGWNWVKIEEKVQAIKLP